MRGFESAHLPKISISEYMIAPPLIACTADSTPKPATFAVEVNLAGVLVDRVRCRAHSREDVY